MTTSYIREPAPEKNADALAELFAAARRSRALATKSKADLVASIPTLVRAIRSGGGQGQRIERLLWSTWNGQHLSGLCDDLTGLDYSIAAATLAMLAARAHMGGDADALLRQIIDESGSCPPAEITAIEK